MKRTALAIAASAMLAVSAFAADPVKSGLKPGEPVPAFQVVDVSGPNKGKQLCYRCQYGQSPVIAAFVKTGTDAAPLLKGIQQLVDEHKASRLRTFVVYMGGPETKASIEKMAAEKGISIPVTFLPQGPSASDIAAYRISPEALPSCRARRTAEANPAERLRPVDSISVMRSKSGSG